MALDDADRELVESELGREPTRAEAALFENLWSEHCAYRSSRRLLTAFDSEGEQVVVGPGDDAAVVAVPTPAGDDEASEADDGEGSETNDGEGSETDDGQASGTNDDEASETYLTFGIESHNHPSYVDPVDGAATGVGGIVRDTMSMGAYPIALLDALYFGDFDADHSRYLFEGVVEGISHYGNSIGVPTVGGSVAFHEDYEGNPLVNVACVGLTDADRLVTADAKRPGNRLVLVGNATGRDGLGGASFASEDLDEDAETEDRPAVQVGDPYAEKRLIECNEALLDEDLVVAARDLGAAGLGGAASEMVAKGGLGAEIDLGAVHQREPNMNATEILLAESQERMCYEVAPDDVERVRALADRFDLGCSVIGEVTAADAFVCTFDGETVVEADAEFLGDGAPANDLERAAPPEPERALPDVGVAEAVETLLASPNTASKEWVYRQYDHEVGVRTATRPGDDAAVLALREADCGLALAAGSEPNWTAAAPYEGARAVAVETATNLAAKGAEPLAAVDCLNGGNPEDPETYGGFAAAVDGLADACAALDLPVVGGNVSLYNDSESGPIPPTPTLAAVGTRPDADAPPAAASGDGTLVVVGDPVLGGDAEPRLGGSEYLAQFGGSDRFPAPPAEPRATVDAVREAVAADHVRAAHDASHGGLLVTLAEMVTPDAGVSVAFDDPNPLARAVSERAGRVVVETTAPDALEASVPADVPTARLGTTDETGRFEVGVGAETLTYDAAEIADLRATIERELA
ncbi:phosphoribosylformylglycinamidine synthase subunit PurL [Halobaculum sp. MBLA0147]|uniref:phosphoribosylformylglycinamidine synthase subunit PurL n=1 Tax=Halobaculum sp. MBLA0147 TaxID=3079934 RepID=UPI0035245EE6